MKTYDPNKLDQFGNPDMKAFWRMSEANATKRLSKWIIPAKYGKWLFLISIGTILLVYRDVFTFWDWFIFAIYTLCIVYISHQDGYWNGYMKGTIDRELKKDILAGKWDN